MPGKILINYRRDDVPDGAAAVNARDRIGNGPWVNAEGVQAASSVDDLHSAINKLDAETGVAETGRRIPGRAFVVNQHDILTGSDENGRALPADSDAPWWGRSP